MAVCNIRGARFGTKIPARTQVLGRDLRGVVGDHAGASRRLHTRHAFA